MKTPHEVHERFTSEANDDGTESKPTMAKRRELSYQHPASMNSPRPDANRSAKFYPLCADLCVSKKNYRPRCLKLGCLPSYEVGKHVILLSLAITDVQFEHQ